jgi:hypothetical protein
MILPDAREEFEDIAKLFGHNVEKSLKHANPWAKYMNHRKIRLIESNPKPNVVI